MLLYTLIAGIPPFSTTSEDSESDILSRISTVCDQIHFKLNAFLLMLLRLTLQFQGSVNFSAAVWDEVSDNLKRSFIAYVTNEC